MTKWMQKSLNANADMVLNLLQGSKERTTDRIKQVETLLNTRTTGWAIKTRRLLRAISSDAMTASMMLDPWYLKKWRREERERDIET